MVLVSGSKKWIRPSHMFRARDTSPPEPGSLIRDNLSTVFGSPESRVATDGDTEKE
jgi:hypothetical protein